jgi:hypothetical protein
MKLMSCSTTYDHVLNAVMSAQPAADVLPAIQRLPSEDKQKLIRTLRSIQNEIATVCGDHARELSKLLTLADGIDLSESTRTSVSRNGGDKGAPITSASQPYKLWEAGKHRFAVTHGLQPVPVIGIVSQDTNEFWKIERAGKILPASYSSVEDAAYALIEIVETSTR